MLNVIYSSNQVFSSRFHHFQQQITEQLQSLFDKKDTKPKNTEPFQQSNFKSNDDLFGNTSDVFGKNQAKNSLDAFGMVSTQNNPDPFGKFNNQSGSDPFGMSASGGDMFGSHPFSDKSNSSAQDTSRQSSIQSDVTISKSATMTG